MLPEVACSDLQGGLVVPLKIAMKVKCLLVSVRQSLLSFGVLLLQKETYGYAV